MTKDERAKALALAGCRMPPATNQKRFARNLAYIAAHDPFTVLTAGQKFYLDMLVYRYRRQLAGNEDFEIPKTTPVKEDYVAAHEERKASRRAAREAREGPIPDQKALF